MPEFIDTMHQFAGQSSDEKLVFLFKVYDLDDDGLIQQSDLREVMKACMVENGMTFDEKEIEDLALALYEDAAGLAESENHENSNVENNKVAKKTGISIEDLKAELAKHDGLLENLSINIGKWLVPPKPPPPKPVFKRLAELLPHQMSLMYIRNNKQFLGSLFVFILVNVILFVMRAYYFRHFKNLDGSSPNVFYMMSRANGRVLLFNSMLILVLVLRYSITKLRELGLASVLPLDNHIYLHKVVGLVIFVQSWIHTIMHLCNFAINVQPDPVRFVQLTSHYWEDFGHRRPGWMNLGYNVPPGCRISNDSAACFKAGSPLDSTLNISICQLCDDNSSPWNYYHWIMTLDPGVFGLLNGIANISGVVLIFILSIIVICSMPFVRRGGYFEVFYFTHLLYIVYWFALILHAPEFWKWIIAPGIIFIMELTYRVLSSWMGKGKTNIYAGVVLPSKVTNLIIKRPHNFNFAPGDWVFVKIPAIAKSEWHPFTISSAPEQQESFTLHIRGVGQWTNRLYSYFEQEYRRQQYGNEEMNSGFGKFKGTVHRKYTTIKNAMSIYNRHKLVERDPSNPDFQSIASKYTANPERSKQRMKMREEKLKVRESYDLNGLSEHLKHHLPLSPSSAVVKESNSNSSKSFRYMRRQPSIVNYDFDELNSNNVHKCRKDGVARLPGISNGHFVHDNCCDNDVNSINDISTKVFNGGNTKAKHNDTCDVHFDEVALNTVTINSHENTNEFEGPGKKMTLHKPLVVFIDGPFGAPSSNIFRAEHAVLIGTGIGVTPFASILQSIMHRYWNVKRRCPKCDYRWSDDIGATMFNLTKVDFFWINRDQTSFEWFVKLLSQLEIEQAEEGGVMGHFLDMHMYITSALQRTDMKAVGLQLALDLLHEKEKRDLVTGLKSRTNAGRPNWNKVFTQIREQRRGRVTVFYCGNPILAKVLRKKCDEFGFVFRKEVF